MEHNFLLGVKHCIRKSFDNISLSFPYKGFQTSGKRHCQHFLGCKTPLLNTIGRLFKRSVAITSVPHSHSAFQSSKTSTLMHSPPSSNWFDSGYRPVLWCVKREVSFDTLVALLWYSPAPPQKKCHGNVMVSTGVCR